MIVVVLFIFIALVLGFGWRSYRKAARPDWKTPAEPFPDNWKNILNRDVLFYASLNPEEKKRFEFKVQEFLLNCRITGIKTPVNLTDKLLVASSAIIPIFGFDSWKYTNIREVFALSANVQ